MRNKRRYLIDGRFLASIGTGVDRYAYELLRELDKICGELDISILVPANAKQIPKYNHIKVILSKRVHFWTQIVFGTYALLHGQTPVNLCNEVSLIAPKGIVCLHDVCYTEPEKQYPCLSHFPKEEREWFLKVYKRICKKTVMLITVSEFSKERIHVLLGVPKEKITVIGNGWQHFEQLEPDEGIFEKYDCLEKKQYFFTLTSANYNKNLEWVLETSKENANEQFVIAGRNLEKVVNFREYSNIVYAKNISDAEIKALMKESKAFIFPSYYEGFGIPPLEALSTGTQVIVSNAASLPEIFGSSVHYIEPDNPKVNLQRILSESVTSRNPVLEKYSWKQSAKQLLALLNSDF